MHMDLSIWGSTVSSCLLQQPKPSTHLFCMSSHFNTGLTMLQHVFYCVEHVSRNFSAGVCWCLCVNYWSPSITLAESKARSRKEGHQSHRSSTLQFAVWKYGQSSTQWLSFPCSSRQRKFWKGQSLKIAWHIITFV